LTKTASRNIDRLFFDIDDTLYSTSSFAETARRNSIDALYNIGIDVPREELYNELKEVISEFSSNYPYHYDKLLLRLPDRVQKDVDKDVAVASAVMAYHRTKHEQLESFDDVHPFFEALSSSNIPNKPAIISEGLSVKQAEKILRLDLYEYFDPHGFFISEKVGISKPNPKLFQTAARQSQTDPQNGIMIGDRLEKDIAPANEVGFHTVHFNRVDKGSKQEKDVEDVSPDFTINKYSELRNLLDEHFQLDIPKLSDVQ
jgi:putative hydrolase of the HAD superfamily